MDQPITTTEPPDIRDNKKLFAVIVAVFVGVSIAFSIAIVFLHTAVNVPIDRVYEVLPGATSREIAYDLAHQHIISHPWLFNLYLSLKNVDTKLQAGRYEFPTGKITIRGLAQILASGSMPREITITIPEGYTVEQIADALAQKGVVKFPNEFFGIAGSRSLKFEGYLFPDTYRFFEDERAEEILDKMLQNFEKKVTLEFRQAVDERGRTIDEVVIMASILEKEVQTEEDMRLVSDILWRRLDVGIPLEVDSALNYILPKEERKPSLTETELDIDSPYNTYKYTGLPPTAICNPGLRTLQAALNPLVNEYWFYLSEPSGETVFARTYKEHLANKARYMGR